MGIQGDRAIWYAESDGLELLNVTIGDLLDRQCLQGRPYGRGISHRNIERPSEMKVA